MKSKPTYDELVLKVKELESAVAKGQQTELPLPKSEDGYRGLFEHMMHEVHIWKLVRDASGTIKTWRLVDANPRALKAWGYSLAEIVGKTTEEIFPDSDPVELFLPMIQKIFAEGKPQEWEHLFPSTNQLLQMITIPFGEYFISTGIGISEEKKRTKELEKEVNRAIAAEKALREKEVKYRTLFEESMIAIFICDPKTMIISEASPMMSELYGYSYAELIGMNCLDLSAEVDESIKATANAIESGSYIVKERRHKRKNGEIFLVELCLSLFVLDDQNYLFSTIRDITEGKRAEGEKTKLENQLQQAQRLESIGRLAGGIAHDFNNLLSVIVNNLKLLQFKQESVSHVDEKVTQAMQASLRAKDLVAQILAFSHQEKLALVPVSLSFVVANALKFLRSMIPSTVEVMAVTTEGPLTINADTTQLQQVLINLCTNAVHAMNEKGLLQINLNEEELTRQEIPLLSASRPGRYAKLSVSDTGKGMDKETLDRIFDPFFTTKGVGVGSGMGLSVVHGIVEQHGGFILVESTPDQGSTFNLYFPITSVDEVTDEAEAEKTLPTGTEHILLVDDEEFVADSCGAILEDLLGYRVTVMTNSVAALDLFRAQPHAYDLVITDQTMPKMSGMELAQELLNIRPELPVILCSGYSAKANEEEAKAIGIRAFCMKPLLMEQLALVVREVLDTGEEPSVTD